MPLTPEASTVPTLAAVSNFASSTRIGRASLWSLEVKDLFVLNEGIRSICDLNGAVISSLKMKKST